MYVRTDSPTVGNLHPSLECSQALANQVCHKGTINSSTRADLCAIFFFLMHLYGLNVIFFFVVANSGNTKIHHVNPLEKNKAANCR